MSAVAMAVGFVVDNFAFGRVDHPATQLVLAGYIALSAISIILLHYFEERAEQHNANFRYAGALSAVTQFAFGGLWSAFLIFYSRSAVIATSWPFLAILLIIFLGNEVFRDYRSRLVFTAILLYFALFSYASFTVPIFTRTIDKRTFLLSGASSVIVFVLFLVVLLCLARARIRRDLGKIVLGAALIYSALNAFYYMDVLPPLPLLLVEAGIFSSKGGIDQKYKSAGSISPWYRRRSEGPQSFQVRRGQPLYAYGAIFAPNQLVTGIVHEWEWYDDANSQWVSETLVKFPIAGGRTNGFRGYSTKSNLRSGNWRVDIETLEGRVISRTNFAVKVAR